MHSFKIANHLVEKRNFLNKNISRKRRKSKQRLSRLINTFRYLTFIKVVEPTLAVLCESYFEKKPDKICYMRIDSLSQFLVLGNVYSHSQALIFETCTGLILAAALERMAPRGRIIRVAPDDAFRTHLHLSQLINHPSNEVKASMITSIPFSYFARAKATGDQQQGDPLKEGEQKTLDELSSTLSGKSRTMMCDSLLIATNHMDHQALTNQLWPLLAPSGSFAIYSSYREPLQILYSELRANKRAVMMQLSETWMREFQVLPHRTHPHMRTSSASGYILSGIKVAV
jgi:tRNA (adenine-N(1)-)-methyltransferase non-catalytic subunit